MLTRQSDQRGAAAILVAASLILLLGITALAVDNGLALDERRLQQGAVDTGVLSAAVSSRVSPVHANCDSGSFTVKALAACNGASVGIDVINKNLSTSFTPTNFVDATRCADAVFDAEFRPANGGVIARDETGTQMNCIRYNRNFSQVRIYLPVTPVETTFGKVLGRSTIDVSAWAQAETHIKRPGSVIPFAVGPSGAAANQACFVANDTSNLNNPPCTSGTSGNYGYLSIKFYGDDELGTPIICDNNDQQGRLAANLAKGADHVFRTDADVPGVVNDTTNCPNKDQDVDQVQTKTGNSQTGLFEGALGLAYGTEGRMLCKGSDSLNPSTADEPTWIDLESEACVNLKTGGGGIVIDHSGLWEYLNPDAAMDVPLCNSSISSRIAMEACIAAWNSNPEGSYSRNLFEADIQYAPRFAWVPILDSNPGGGLGDYMINDFRPVYLQTLYLGCSANRCDVVHDPGQPSIGSCPSDFSVLPLQAPSCGWPYTGNKNIEALTSFMLRRDMLPSPVSDFPYLDDQRTYNLSR